MVIKNKDNCSCCGKWDNVIDALGWEMFKGWQGNLPFPWCPPPKRPYRLFIAGPVHTMLVGSCGHFLALDTCSCSAHPKGSQSNVFNGSSVTEMYSCKLCSVVLYAWIIYLCKWCWVTDLTVSSFLHCYVSYKPLLLIFSANNAPLSVPYRWHNLSTFWHKSSILNALLCRN